MKYLNSLNRRTFLLAGLVAAFFTGNSTPLEAGIDYVPPGDLTVTVEEQGDGSVKFTLSGTAYMQHQAWCMVETNFNPCDELPPFASYDDFDLPSGLTLTVSRIAPASAPENDGPQEVPAPTNVLDVYQLQGGNAWTLDHDSSGYLNRGDTMTGAGSVTTSEIPFNLFTPGTFVIEAGEGGMGSEADPSVEESPIPSAGVYPYSITYKVIAAKPSLTVSGPGAFPKTVLGKKSRVKQVTITNDGSAPLTGLNLSIAGRGARDFSPSALSRTNLPAGASTLVDVRFRPKRTGKRSATLTVNGLYTPPTYPEIPAYTSAEEGMPDPVMSPAPTPVVVSASTALTGKGLSGRTRRANTPRFPYGRR